MKILVGYDGSDVSRRALVHAAELVGRGGEVQVINVIAAQPVSSSVDAIGDGERRLQRNLLREAGSLLRQRDVRMSALRAVGDPTTEIRAAAENSGARVIVVGRGDGVPRLIKGSVSTRLVRHAPCDVLVVH